MLSAWARTPSKLMLSYPLDGCTKIKADFSPPQKMTDASTPLVTPSAIDLVPIVSAPVDAAVVSLAPPVFTPRPYAPLDLVVFQVGAGIAPLAFGREHLTMKENTYSHVGIIVNREVMPDVAMLPHVDYLLESVVAPGFDGIILRPLAAVIARAASHGLIAAVLPLVGNPWPISVPAPEVVDAATVKAQKKAAKKSSAKKVSTIVAKEKELVAAIKIDKAAITAEKAVVVANTKALCAEIKKDAAEANVAHKAEEKQAVTTLKSKEEAELAAAQAELASLRKELSIAKGEGKKAVSFDDQMIIQAVESKDLIVVSLVTPPVVEKVVNNTLKTDDVNITLRSIIIKRIRKALLRYSQVDVYGRCCAGCRAPRSLFKRVNIDGILGYSTVRMLKLSRRTWTFSSTIAGVIYQCLGILSTDYHPDMISVADYLSYDHLTRPHLVGIPVAFPETPGSICLNPRLREKAPKRGVGITWEISIE